jgi:hypothetical protein
MSQILVLASHATRHALHANLLRGMIVGGCGLALVLARMPIGF